MDMVTAMTVSNPRLEIGSMGDAVRQVQIIIQIKAGGDLPITGLFDEKTHDRVMDIQRFFGITEDGIVDSETWEVLEMLAAATVPIQSKRQRSP